METVEDFKRQFADAHRIKVFALQRSQWTWTCTCGKSFQKKSDTSTKRDVAENSAARHLKTAERQTYFPWRRKQNILQREQEQEKYVRTMQNLRKQQEIIQQKLTQLL